MQHQLTEVNNRQNQVNLLLNINTLKQNYLYEFKKDRRLLIRI